MSAAGLIARIARFGSSTARGKTTSAQGMITVAAQRMYLTCVNMLHNTSDKRRPAARSRIASSQALVGGFDLFLAKYEAKYPKAATCLAKDREELLAFYDFPAEHWKHLRTTNPIESTFATVRLRTKRTKGSGSRVACLTMVFKLAQAAERKWRKLNGYQLLGDVIRGVQFKDGTKVAA